MTLIEKYHYEKDCKTYQRQVDAGMLRQHWPVNLSLREVAPSLQTFLPRINRVSLKWHWNRQDRYNDGSLEAKLAHPETRLLDLCDNGEPVGYALISKPGETVHKRFWSAANDVRVIEIENLGLFPGQEGDGRGKAFFEMVFQRLFADYDIVYWSQNNVHSPTLSQFYRERLGMTLLATDSVQDFRPRVTGAVA